MFEATLHILHGLICRIGSLERLLPGPSTRIWLICRIGSLEMPKKEG